MPFIPVYRGSYIANNVWSNNRHEMFFLYISLIWEYFLLYNKVDGVIFVGLYKKMVIKQFRSSTGKKLGNWNNISVSLFSFMCNLFQVNDWRNTFTSINKINVRLVFERYAYIRAL